jgi:CheY-like chemotaxis protein
VVSRTIKLLHVEDSALPRRIVAQQLAAVPDYTFAITYAATEDEAVAAFAHHQSELVLLDYHLEEGDGLSCLRRLREADAVVPVIVVSGQECPEVAADLLQAGADDYIGKNDLGTDALARSVCAALARVDGWRRYHPSGPGEPAAPPEALFRRLSQQFVAGVGPKFLGRLEEFEGAARRCRVSAEQVRGWFEAACAEMGASHPGGPAVARRLLRPVLLEVLLRLAGDLVDDIGV